MSNADSLYDQMHKTALLPQEVRIRMGLAVREEMQCQFDKSKVIQHTICASCPEHCAF